MKPVAIFQHTPAGQPGAVLPILDRLSIPWELIPIMDGAPVPTDPAPYSGMVFMGGSMGVNDGLPWISEEIELIRRADQEGLPIIGHCLGSQVMANAFGSPVRRNEVMEIGWLGIEMAPITEAQEWFGTRDKDRLVFQWHADTFDMPLGAVRLASSPHCQNQAFLFNDRHLGMQFHLEMTPELVAFLLEVNGPVLDRQLAKHAPAVNTREELLDRLDARTRSMHELLEAAYTRWAKGLVGV